MKTVLPVCTLGIMLLAGCQKKMDIPSSVTEIISPEPDLTTIITDSAKVDSTWKASPEAEAFADGCSPYFKGHIETVDSNQAPLLANAVLEWMNEECFGGACTAPMTAEGLFKSYLDSYVFGNEDNYNPDCATTIKINKIYENAQIITFCHTVESYNLGAAHGGYHISGATFRKSDGKRFGWNMFRGNADIHKILKEGLKEYFEVKTDEELKDCLMIGEFESVDYLDRPVFEPYVTENGIEFIYQQYEIACYAAGLPSFTLPLSKAQSVLTPTAQKLF